MNDKMKLKKLSAEIDAAYAVIRRCAHAAAEIIYGDEGKESVGDMMDSLALSDAEGGTGSNAQSVLLFLHERICTAQKIKAIWKDSCLTYGSMDLGELESYLKDEES